MKKKGNIGHLISIENTSTGKREFLFLYITGDEPTGAYKRVVKGIRSLRLSQRIKPITSIRADAVTDFPQIDRDYPETAGETIHELPVVAFYDGEQKALKEKLFLSGVGNIIEKGGAFFPSNRLPAVVTGSDFFDREDMLDRLWRFIEKGQNTIICGPRRYGKTSIMRALKDGAFERGFRPIMIDLESVLTPEEFVSRVWVEVEWPHLTRKEKNKKAEEIEDELRDSWSERGTRIFQEIAEKGDNLLFLLDECPYMLDSFLGIYDAEKRDSIDESDREKANHFVKWFREQRDLLAQKAVFCITGSIRLTPYLKDIHLDRDDFSDCKEVGLTFFDPETVRTYVEGLLLGQDIFLSGDVIDEIVRLTIPGIPYFVQIVVNHVSALNRENPAFSVVDLRNTYHERIIGMEGRRLFDTFDRHFKRYGRREPGAKGVLRELSEAGDEGLEKRKLKKIYTVNSVISKSGEFDIVLSYLEYDFYIERVKGTNRYRFASPILRDYWQKNQ